MTCMSRFVLWALALAVAVAPAAGCKKSSSSSGDIPVVSDAQAAPPSPRGPVSAAPATAGQPVVIADTGDINATLERLTAELRKYVVGSRSVPKTFEEFVTKAQLEFPAPPEGKQYRISGQAVVLGKK